MSETERNAEFRKSDPSGEPLTSPFASLSSRQWVWLFSCVLLFIALRARWIGHLLVWDEAITLCTIRSFASGGTDTFSDWFWRHPPLHTMLLLLLAPFRFGFAERAETLSVGFGVINLLALFSLNRRVFSTTMGLLSAFFLAVTPGSVFFDVWIKQDISVASFGLIGLWLLCSHRTLPGAVCLGLSMLCKETGVFYAFAAILLWFGGICGKRTLKDFLVLSLVPAVTCGWWYLIVLPRVAPKGRTAEHLQFFAGSQPGWAGDWNYYFRKLPLELGWIGIVLAVLGACVLVWQLRKRDREQHAGVLWPLALLAPPLVVLSSIPGKVPWIVISLLPAWTTLQAVGASAMISLANRISQKSLRSISQSNAPVVMASALLVVVVLFATSVLVVRRDYESVLKQIDEGQWAGASYSREAAEAMNERCKDGERALIESFHYWREIPPGHPCPIFACYFRKKVDVLIRPHDAPFSELVADIEKHRLDWALLSPEPGSHEYEVFSGFERTLGLRPISMRQARLYRTSSLYEKMRERYRCSN